MTVSSSLQAPSPHVNRAGVQAGLRGPTSPPGALLHHTLQPDASDHVALDVGLTQSLLEGRAASPGRPSRPRASVAATFGSFGEGEGDVLDEVEEALLQEVADAEEKVWGFGSCF